MKGILGRYLRLLWAMGKKEWLELFQALSPVIFWGLAAFGFWQFGQFRSIWIGFGLMSVSLTISTIFTYIIERIVPKRFYPIIVTLLIVGIVATPFLFMVFNYMMFGIQAAETWKAWLSAVVTLVFSAPFALTFGAGVTILSGFAVMYILNRAEFNRLSGFDRRRRRRHPR